MQEAQHNKENVTLAGIREVCHKNGIPFMDVHDDFKTGIDVIIDGKKYDLKASQSNKLTLFKQLPGGTVYCPLDNHEDVDYLIPNEWGVLCVLKKAVAKSHALRQNNLGLYTGDGNINVTFDVPQHLLQPLIVNGTAFTL